MDDITVSYSVHWQAPAPGPLRELVIFFSPHCDLTPSALRHMLPMLLYAHTPKVYGVFTPYGIMYDNIRCFLLLDTHL